MSHRLPPVSSLETVPATHAAVVEAGREFAVASVSEDVGCFGGRSGGPACGSRGRGHPIDFVVPVRNSLPFWIPLRANQKRSGWIDNR